MSQIGDAGLGLLVLLLGRIECLLEGGELAAQRGNLLVENLHLRQRAGAELFLRIELTAELSNLALSARRPAADALIEAAIAVAIAFRRGEARANLRELLLETELAGFFQGEKLSELRDLCVETGQRRIFSRDFLGEIKLQEHKHREQEHDAEDEGRERIDEARPIIQAAVPACACKGHRAHLFVHVFPHEDFQEPADIAMLLGLGVHPIANHLLLRAHVLDQPLNGFREIGHGGCGRPARSAFCDHIPQAVDRAFEIPRKRARRRGSRALTVDDEIAHRGGQPILEIGVEPVLRLARLDAIPWFIRGIWIVFWCYAITYAVLWLLPALQSELLSPP